MTPTIDLPVSTTSKTNNQRLRELVLGAGLSQTDALEIFNRGLGIRGFKENAWKAFFCAPASQRYRYFGDAYLAHAESVFGPLQGQQRLPVARPWPLRRVVGTMPHPNYPDEPTMVREVYECGHIFRPKQLAHGYTQVSKRRCIACAEGRAPDLTPKEVKRIEGEIQKGQKQ